MTILIVPLWYENKLFLFNLTVFYQQNWATTFSFRTLPMCENFVILGLELVISVFYEVKLFTMN